MMTPIPVLFWMNSPSFGGTERMNLRIIQRLDPEEFAVDILFFEKNRPDLIDEFRNAARSIFFADILGIPATVSLLRKYPLIYAFGLKGNLCARLVKLLHPSTTVIASLHSVIPHTNLDSRGPVILDKATWRIADEYVANAASAIRYLQENHGYPARFRVIEHGLDLGEFDNAPTRFSLRERFRLPDSARVLLTVGSLNRIKNHAMILEALAGLGRSDLHAFFVGKGPLDRELEDRARELNLGARLHILSEEPEVVSFLRQSDLFVSTSKVEGLPGAIMEAMASRLPVVATEVHGNDQLVFHEKTGLAVPLGNTTALGSALERLLADPPLGARLAQEGRRLIEEKFTLERTVRLTAELFREKLKPA